MQGDNLLENILGDDELPDDFGDEDEGSKLERQASLGGDTLDAKSGSEASAVGTGDGTGQSRTEGDKVHGLATAQYCAGMSGKRTADSNVTRPRACCVPQDPCHEYECDDGPCMPRINKCCLPPSPSP